MAKKKNLMPAQQEAKEIEPMRLDVDETSKSSKNLVDLRESGRSEETATTRKRQRPAEARRRRKAAFYAESLDVTEQAHLHEALEMEGLDEEIALLRVRLRRALEDDPEDTDFLLKGIALLARLMATRYRLSKTAEDDLYQNMLGVIKGIGGAIWPEAFLEGGE